MFFDLQELQPLSLSKTMCRVLYLLEYVCPRGPLRLNLIQRLLSSVSLLRPWTPLPAFPWLARLAASRSSVAVKAAMEAQACVLCIEPAICGYDRSVATLGPLSVNPPALRACMLCTRCGCCWGRVWRGVVLMITSVVLSSCLSYFYTMVDLYGGMGIV